MSAFWCIFTKHAPFTLIVLFYYGEVEYISAVLLLLQLVKYRNYCLIISVVLMMCLFSPSFSYPAEQQEPKHKWWLDPCQGRVMEPKHSHTRHGRSADENQLKKFMKHLNHNIKLLYGLYYNSTERRVPRITMHSLPFLRIKKLEKELQNYTNEIQKFYMRLQYFAECTDKLYRAEVQTPSNFDPQKRKKIFYNSTRQLQLVLCEFNDVLHTSNVSLSESKVHCKPYDSMKLSKAKVADLVFFQKMKKILKKSKRTLRCYKRCSKKKRPCDCK